MRKRDGLITVTVHLVPTGMITRRVIRKGFMGYSVTAPASKEVPSLDVSFLAQFGSDGRIVSVTI